MTPIQPLIHHVCSLLHEQDIALLPAEALVLSGAAFRHYLFNADINHGWRACHPGVELRPQSWAVDHYGALGALQAHTGQHIIPYRHLKLGEALQLLEHETSDNRICLMAHDNARGTTSAVFAERLVRDGKRFEIHGRAIDAPAATPTGLLRELQLQDIAEVRSAWPGLAWILVARPADEPASERLRATLRRDVLRYAVQHGRNDKELHAEDELFYATSAAAWTHLQTLIRGDLPPTPAEPGTDQTTRGNETGWTCDRLTDFVHTHLEELAEAREAAACVLIQWAESGDWSEDEARAMQRAASHWSVASARLGMHLHKADRLPSITLLEEAAAHDLAGFGALTAAFRPGFG